ncbi:PilW family protein [Longimicrobium sp.]|uniref:PilW family protein n=1 Tax=Longimicrobium sp. TaxID=2029185 RepID=UPI002E337156|nr:prepilin-type N-terminal cleavage/methylation domain-containing protein [Longimicrobium sp.]HEX6040741.1 prepilin-type N-terminal cleavage/methylation domain-containing protein [Longimicrobium sp.]
MRYADVRRARRGFTLVEVLVALVIAGLLGAVIFQMMNGQSRIVAAQSAREEAQQNARGSLEVISSELRGAMPGGILAADAQSLTYMLPRVWGHVCGTSGANTLTALFPNTGATLPAAGEATGVMVNTGTLTAPSWSPAPPTRIQVTAIRNVGGPTAAACSALGASGDLVALEIDGAGLAAHGAQNRTVVLYTMTRYDLGQTGGASWLQRTSGMSNGQYVQQPLAGPVEPAKVQFQYFGTSATTPLGTPVATPSSIRMVRVQVVTNSAQTLNGRVQRDSGAVTVMLRNN